MMICTFDTKKDLARVHQVLFDSLLENKSATQALNELVNSGYFQIYNDTLTNIEDIESFQSYLTDVIGKAFNTFKEFSKTLPEFDSFKNELENGFDLDNSVSAMIYNIADIKNKVAVSKALSGEGESETPVVESAQNEPVFTEPETSFSENDNVKPSFIYGKEISIANIKVNSVRDIENQYYPGSKLAFKMFSSSIKEKLIHEVIIPVAINEVPTELEFNKKIQNVRSELLGVLTGDVKDYYGDDYNAALVNKIIKDAENEFDSLGVSGTKLNTWVKSDLRNTQLQKYNAYVTLKHFDKLMGEFSGNMIAVNGRKDLETNNIKYYPSKNNKLRSGFRDSGIDVSALDQTSDFFDIFISSIKLVDLETGKVRPRNLEKLPLNNSLSKILKSISVINPVQSIRTNLQNQLINNINNKVNDLNKTDFRTILSYYLAVHADAELALDPVVKEFSKGDSKIIDNIKSSYGTSLYGKYLNYKPILGNINLYEAIVTDTLSMDKANYYEVYYDNTNNTLEYRNFSEKESDKQYRILKNITTTSALESKENLEYYKSLGRFDVDGVEVNFMLPGDVKAIYNVSNGRITDVNGEDFDFTGLNVPSFSEDVSDIALINDTGKYKAYFDLIESFDAYLKQPLSSENYRLLDMLREQMDTKDSANHLGVIMKVMGNIAFLNTVNLAEDSLNASNVYNKDNDPVNKDYEEIFRDLRSGLISLNIDDKIDASDLWNEKQKMFNLELTNDVNAKGLQEIKKYSEVLNDFYNTSNRSVVINTQGNAVPMYIISSLGQRTHMTADKVRKKGFVEKIVNGKSFTINSPLKHNVLVADNHILKNIEINSGIKGMDGSAIKSGDATFSEIFDANIRGNFLSNFIKLKNGVTAYQSANFSDKEKHIAANILRDAEFTLNGKRGKIGLGDNQFTTDEIAEGYMEYSDVYYKNITKNILLDYYSVLTNDIAYDDNGNPVRAYGFTYAAYADSILSRIAPGLLEGDVKANIANAKSIFAQEEDVIKQLNNIEHIYNVFNNKTLLDEVASAIQGKRSKNYNETDKLISAIDTVDNVINKLSGGAINNAFNFANVDIVKTYHFDTNNKKNNIHKTLKQNLNNYNIKNRKDYIKSVEEGFVKSIVGKEEFTEENIKNFKNKLEVGTEFTLDLLNNEGKVDNNLKAYLSIAGDEVLEFIDNDFARMKLFLIRDDNSFELNPLLKRFLWEQNLFGRSFHHLAVGSEMGHPVKNASEGTERSAAFAAQNKRNVIYNASYNSLHMNGLSGITGKTKLLTIADFEQDVALPYGLRAAVEPSDGSAMNNPLHLLMHNASMATPISTNSLKNIQGAIDERTGMATLLKYAEFPTLNANIRKGYNDQGANLYHMFMFRTMSEKFDTIGEGNDAQKINVDITKDYNGDSTQFILDQYEPTFIFNSKLESDFNMDFKNPTTGEPQIKEGELVTLRNIESRGDNGYILTYEIKDSLNEVRELKVPKIIDNLYDFWGALGGAYAMEYDANEFGKFEDHINTPLDGYIPSENNVKALFEYMNLVGSKIYNSDNTIDESIFKEQTTTPFDAISSYYQNSLDTIINDESEIENFNTKNNTQFNVIQPLKVNLIGRATFASGAKVGATNVNKVSDFTNPVKKLKYSSISSLYYGPQLSAEHAVGDHDEVTEQSQIISALNFIGHSPEHAEKAFNAIAGYISGKLDTLMTNVFKFDNPELKKQVDIIVRKVVSKALDGRDITGMANFVVDKVRQEIANNLPPTYQVPFSSPDVYNTVYNALNNYLSKEGVKRKLKGLAAVLKPNLMMVRNVTIKTDDGYVTTTMQEDEYQEYIKNREGDTGRFLNYAEALDFDVDMFSTVQKLDEDGNVLKTIYLDNISKYNMIKQDMLSNPTKYRIDLEASRILKPNTTSWSSNGITYNNYDMQVTILPNMGFGYDEVVNQIKKLRDRIRINELTDKYNGTVSNNDTLLNEIAELEIQARSMEARYKDLLEFTGINDLIEELNQEEVVVNVVKNDDNSFSYKTETQKVEPISKLPEELSEFNNIIDKKGNLDEKLRNLFKNIGNQEYKMLHKGFVKPNIYEIDLINGGDTTILDREVYDDKGNRKGSLQTVLEYNSNNSDNKIKLSDLYFKIDKVTTNPGEILAPGIYRKQLKLSAKHTPNNIKLNDFVKTLEKAKNPAVDTYDILIPNANGEHMYVLFKNSDTYNDLISSGQLTKDTRDNIITDESTNKHYLKDGLENRIHELPSNDLYVLNKNGKALTFVVLDKNANPETLRNIVKDKNNGFKQIKPNYVNFDNLNLYLKFGDVEHSKILRRINNYIKNRRESELIKLEQDLVYLQDIDNFNLETVELEIDKMTAYMLDDTNPNKINLTNKLKSYHKLRSALLDNNQEVIDSIILDITTRRTNSINNKIAKINDDKPLSNREITVIQNIIDELEYDENRKNRERILDTAEKQYASLKASLHISAARIPGQHYQSFMGQKIVGFTDNEENIAYVSNTHMLITGEDFDIDKAYLSYYGLNKEGILVGWVNNRFWRSNSEEDLLNSLRLPLPEKINVDKTIVYKNSIKGLSAEEVNALANPETVPFKILVDALNTASAMIVKNGKTDDRPKSFYFRSADQGVYSEETAAKALDYLETYFNEGHVDPKSKDYNLAYTNAIVSGIINSANDIRNLNEQLSPVSFGVYGDMAGSSQKGKEMKLMNYENFADILKAQIYAMVGKNVIGIAAAGGLKPYSILAQNYTMISRTGEGPKFVFRGSNTDIVNNRLSTIDLNDPISRENATVHIVNDAFGVKSLSDVESFDDTTKQQYYNALTQVKKGLDQRYLKREDAAFALSAILSAATDNAKELILGAINAGPDTVGYYMAAAVANIPTLEIANVMTSSTVEAIEKFSRRNTIKGVNRQFDKLVTQLREEKIFRLDGYFPKNSTKAISDKLWELEDDGKINFDINGTNYNLTKLIEWHYSDKIKEEKMNELINQVRNSPNLTIGILFSNKHVLNQYNKVESLIENIGDIYISENTMSDDVNENYSISLASPTSQNPEDQFSDDFANELSNDTVSEMDDPSVDTNDYVEMNSEFFENSEFQNIYVNKLKATVFLNRYVNDARRLMTSIDTNVLDTLIDLKPFKDDMSTLGKMAGVNQGLKNNYLDGYNYLNIYQNYLNEMAPDLLNTLDSTFDGVVNYEITDVLQRYMNDKVFKEAVNNEIQKDNRINLLELMDNTPHMQRMLELAISSVKLNKNISFKTRLFDNVMKKTTEMNFPVTRQNIKTVENYIDELVILTGLKQMNSTNPEMLTFTNKDGDSMNITTLEGRIDFINWIESEVINNLRKGVLLDENNKAYKEPNLKNNDFIKNITPDSKLDAITKNRFNYLTIRANTTRMQSDQDILRLENITHDFNKLRYLKYGDKSLTDLFFFYNLIIFKDKNRNGSFNPLLGSVPDNYENNSAMAMYKQIIAKVDTLSDYNGEEDINIYDLFAKGYAKQVSYKPKNYQGVPAIRIYNPNGDIIYGWEQTGPELKNGEYVQLNTENLDKYLNIENNSDNYVPNIDKIKTQDDKVMILKNNVAKFIRTSLVNEVNC